MNDNLILSQAKVIQIIQRIAYQIYENNMGEDIVFVGTNKGGSVFAEQIRNAYKKISGKEVVSLTLSIDKENPTLNTITLEGSESDSMEAKTVIICDDVLNSGKTLAYSMAKILSLKAKKIEIAVLVLRTHGRFPIYATYKGYELSTSINEHVEVRPNEGIFLH